MLFAQSKEKHTKVSHFARLSKVTQPTDHINFSTNMQTPQIFWDQDFFRDQFFGGPNFFLLWNKKDFRTTFLVGIQKKLRKCPEA